MLDLETRDKRHLPIPIHYQFILSIFNVSHYLTFTAWVTCDLWYPIDRAAFKMQQSVRTLSIIRDYKWHCRKFRKQVLMISSHHDSFYQIGKFWLRPFQFSEREDVEYYLESQQSAEALSSPHLNFYISYILLFNLHLYEAKFWFEKLLFHPTFISLCLLGLNLNVSIFIKPISKIGWYQENLSYFLTGLKIFVSDKGIGRANQMVNPAKSWNKMQKSQG